MTRPTTAPPIPEMPDLPQALCAQIGPADDIFFPKAGDNATAAKRICARCPEIEACLAYALANDVEGVWGGTGAGERIRWRRRNDVKVNTMSTVSVVEARQIIVEPPARNRTTVETIAHGTVRGLKQHHRLNVAPCDDCLAADRVYRGQLRARRAA